MHLDSLPKKLVTYLQSNAALRPLTAAMEDDLLLATAALHTGDPVIAGLWFDDFLSQRGIALADPSEVREQFVAASHAFKAVYKTDEEPTELPSQAQRVADPFRPEYISEVGTPVYNETAREFLERFGNLPEGTQQRILYELTLAHRPSFDHADEMKPSSLQHYRGVTQGIQSLKELLAQARTAQDAFQVALNGYSVNLRKLSPPDYFYEVMEPHLQAWGDALEEALAKFKQVEHWQENSGTSAQKKQLGELWSKEFIVLRNNWSVHQGENGLTKLLETLQRLGKQDRLLGAPGDERKRKP